jgi:hypothetical protein
MTWLTLILFIQREIGFHSKITVGEVLEELLKSPP